MAELHARIRYRKDNRKLDVAASLPGGRVQAIRARLERGHFMNGSPRRKGRINVKLLPASAMAEITQLEKTRHRGQGTRPQPP